LLLLELGRCKPGDLFELAGEMGKAAIVHFMRDIRERHLFIYKQLFHPFDLVTDVKFLDGLVLRLREKIGHIGIIMLKPFLQVCGKIIYQWILVEIDDLNDDILYFLHEDLLFILEQLDAGLVQYRAKLIVLQKIELLLRSYLADLYGNGVKSKPVQLIPDKHQLAETNCIFYK